MPRNRRRCSSARSSCRRILIDCIPESAPNFSILATRYEELGTSLGRNWTVQGSHSGLSEGRGTRERDQEPNPLTQALDLEPGDHLEEAGKTRRGREALSQVPREIREAGQSEPRVPSYRAHLADTLFNLGKTLARDSKETEPIFRRASEAYLGLVAEAPDVSQHRNHLASTLLNLTNLCFVAGRLREAELTARQARVLFEVLIEESPGSRSIKKGWRDR